MITDFGSSENERGLRSYIPYLAAFVVVSLLFLGWVLSSGRFQREAAAGAARSQAAQNAARSLTFYGNGKLKILSFYAQPGERAGSPGLVCYGVSNAADVTIEPALGNTWPSTSRCLEAAPAKDTEYKLTARDNGGHQLVQTAVLVVQGKRN